MTRPSTIIRDHGAETLSRWIFVGGGRRDLWTHLLAIAAFATATVVLLLTLGVNAGLSERIERAAWTVPAAAENPVVTQSTSTRYIAGNAVTVVHLAPLAEGGQEMPVPPGLGAFPTPGQTWMSPALRDLIAATPGSAGLGPSTGEVGRQALTGPDQLLAIVGMPPGHPALSGPGLTDQIRVTDYSGAVGIASFEGAELGSDVEIKQYQWLVLVASVLLIVPALSLAAAASRLSSSRRQARLAGVRLAGASRRTIVTLTLHEAFALSGLGVLAGLLGYGALLPVAARTPMLGTPWYVSDLWVGILMVPVVLLVMAAVAATSALAPVREVLANPIAIAQRTTPSLPHWWRLVAGIAVAAGFYLLSEREGTDGTQVLIALAAMFAVMNVLGPFVLSVVGRWMVRTAKNGVSLIAARRLLDDPRGAWRQVCALALAAFIAGFFALFSVGGGPVFRGDAWTLEVMVPQEQTAYLVEQIESELSANGLTPRVSARDESDGAFFALQAAEGEIDAINVVLPNDEAEAALTRAVVATVAPTAPAATGLDVQSRDDQYGRDFRLATVVILAVSFMVAVVSTAITAAASVLDRRETYQRLWQAGVPLSLLHRARLKQVTVPVVLASVISAGAGLFAASPLTLGGARVELAGVLLLLGSLAFGVIATRVGVQASRPLLARVSKTS